MVSGMNFDDPHLARTSESLQVSRHLQEALSWSVAAELLRRHPDEMRLIETHPNGIYDCLSVFSMKGETLFAHLNRGQNTHITVFHSQSEQTPVSWPHVALTTNVREVALSLERQMGLAAPSETPVTTPSTIGVRLVAQLLAGRALDRQPLFALNGCADGIYAVFTRKNFFEEFPKLAASLGQDFLAKDPDIRQEKSSYDYWFIVPGQIGDDLETCLSPEHRPIVAIDSVHGILWNAKGKYDLMQEYEKCGRSLHSLQAKLVTLS